MPEAAKKTAITLSLNGQERTIEAWPMARLLDVLREELDLTGTKEGCGEGECGACSVFIDGVLVNSCLVPAIQARGCEIVTVEGLAEDARWDTLRRVFVEQNAAQCGICTPGMIMAAAALLEAQADPDDAAIREGLAGNLCRCTGYVKILDAVRAAAEAKA